MIGGAVLNAAAFTGGEPSELQKQGELLFVGGGALALGYAAFRFL